MCREGSRQMARVWVSGVSKASLRPSMCWQVVHLNLNLHGGHVLDRLLEQQLAHTLQGEDPVGEVLIEELALCARGWCSQKAVTLFYF